MRHLGWTPGCQLEPRDKDGSVKEQRAWMKMEESLVGNGAGMENMGGRYRDTHSPRTKDKRGPDLLEPGQPKTLQGQSSREAQVGNTIWESASSSVH